MTLKLFNTLTRKKEEFKPIEDNLVRMYTCGPTVYNYAHIGNFRSFIFMDILRRYLKYKGYKLKHVMNITDVDDKTIKNSKKEGKTLKEFTGFYTKEFFKDFYALNIEKPELIVKATDHIPEMVKTIKTLLEKGYAYKGEDGSIYFSIKKFKDYGKLAQLEKASLKDAASGRVTSDEYDKVHARDFALWKTWSKEDGDVFWETEIGKGRAGWHIECSSMSCKYLDNPFDLHTGGVDLVFPHHTNEIAQSEAETGKKFVNYWVHCEHLLVDGKKMSKSLGNFYTLRDVFKKGYKPLAIRHTLLSTHYRQQQNFTFESVNASENSIQRLNELIIKLKEVEDGDENKDVKKLIKDAKKRFEAAMDDDLNTSEGLASVFEFAKKNNKILSEEKISKKNSDDCLDFLKSVDSVFGIMQFEQEAIDKEIEDLIIKREEARKNKEFKIADKIRDELKDKGVILDDTPQGTRWKRV